jgi:hypothetical protein
VFDAEKGREFSTFPHARPVAPPQVQVPTPETRLIMIRVNLIGLNQANAPQTLSGKFAGFRTNRIDFSPVALVQPQLTQPEFHSSLLLEKNKWL